MKVSIIVAIDKKRGIGKNNDLLFKIPEDLKRFRAITKGHPIIMGRKTFESIGKVLPNRTNIIITRDPNYKAQGGVVVHSLEEAIKLAKETEKQHLSVIARNEVTKQSLDSGQALRLRSGRARMTREIATLLSVARDDNAEVFVIGGGRIFQQTISLADKLYLTIVDKEYEADTYFPDYSDFKKVVFEQKGESSGYRYTFLELEK